ncbi:MAG: leucine-rich repeat protein [Ruminococcus sp.]|nr:leucine-rich repeat protein [Ruminococcus sp.]
MKKLRRISALFLSLILIAVTVVQINAATVYQLDGYSYTVISTGLISLYDWDNRSTTLTVPEKLGNNYFYEIGDYSIRGNSVITVLDLKNAKRLNRIGIMAFENCPNISGEVFIPFTVGQIGLGAFQGCTSLETATIDANVSAIPAQCFNDCTSLKNVALPSMLSRIEKFAFADCTSLESILIPKNVVYIDPTAFENDDNLVIHCYANSTAHQFAVENGYKFFLVDRILGDVNGDRSIDILDVTRIQKYRADLVTFDEAELERADVNGDGKVTIRDATLIQMFISETITEF